MCSKKRKHYCMHLVFFKICVFFYFVSVRVRSDSKSFRRNLFVFVDFVDFKTRNRKKINFNEDLKVRMTISRMLGCNELNPWIRDVYNVTLKNGTSTDELPGHLNLCFFDTIVVSAWSVFAGMVLLYIMYHLTKHHAVETNHKKWSKSIVRWRYVNLIFPSILFVLSSIVLFEDTYNLRFSEGCTWRVTI